MLLDSVRVWPGWLESLDEEPSLLEDSFVQVEGFENYHLKEELQSPRVKMKIMEKIWWLERGFFKTCGPFFPLGDAGSGGGWLLTVTAVASWVPAMLFTLSWWCFLWWCWWCFSSSSGVAATFPPAGGSLPVWPSPWWCFWSSCWRRCGSHMLTDGSQFQN